MIEYNVNRNYSAQLQYTTCFEYHKWGVELYCFSSSLSVDFLTSAVPCQVKLFTICHMYEPWMDLSSPVVRLQTLSFGLLLATCADSSIRVVSCELCSRVTWCFFPHGAFGRAQKAVANGT